MKILNKEFEKTFVNDLEELFLWRRDVKSFSNTTIDQDTLERLMSFACKAPSVGNSQPWRFMLINTLETRQAIFEEFKRENKQAAERYKKETKQEYLKLKLEGLLEAPSHLAVYSETTPLRGKGLGRSTMPETVRYSTVLAIGQLWLHARALGLGLGWVSILNPKNINQILQAPKNWDLIAYLCLGYPKLNSQTPYLEEVNWQSRDAFKEFIIYR